MNKLDPVAFTPWAPHESAAPRTDRDDQGRLLVGANGTRTCCGGWQCRFDAIIPGRWYRLRTQANVCGHEHPRDITVSTACWSDVGSEAARPPISYNWDYLLPTVSEDGNVIFERLLQAPANAPGLTIRCTWRWAAEGESTWTVPSVEEVPAPPAREPVRVAVVTGHAHQRNRAFETVQDNVAFYAEICEAACVADNLDLIALPEIAVQWQVPGTALDLAVPVPGPETEVFAALARKYQVRIVLGLSEQDDDAVFNTAALIGPDGNIDGRYHKVHLASSEAMSGVTPGDTFPVYETEAGRIGCNICMDSSAAESARMVGLNGADFLVLPIMGDHRASRWNPGSPIFNEGRWRAIMRTRAMDNQLCMVVARNTVQGSCIIDRKGEILAWNEGDQSYICATVLLDDGYRTWSGGCFRDVNWLQRRPHLYTPFVDAGNVGNMRISG